MPINLHALIYHGLTRKHATIRDIFHHIQKALPLNVDTTWTFFAKKVTTFPTEKMHRAAVREAADRRGVQHASSFMYVLFNGAYRQLSRRIPKALKSVCEKTAWCGFLAFFRTGHCARYQPFFREKFCNQKSATENGYSPFWQRAVACFEALAKSLCFHCGEVTFSFGKHTKTCVSPFSTALDRASVFFGA